MTAAEPTPLEAAAEALLHYETSGLCDLGKACGLCDCGMNLLSPADRDQRTRREIDRARHAAEALLAGDWLERVLAETGPCVWSIREEKHPYGESCLHDHPDRHPGVGFCWVRPKKQAAAIRATAGVGL